MFQVVQVGLVVLPPHDLLLDRVGLAHLELLYYP